MTTEAYGTATYYAKLFGDIIADVQADNPTTSDNLIEGFKIALQSWREFYEQSAEEIKRIQQKLDDEG